MDKLGAMSAFAKVVALGSFAEAARTLGTTRSAASKAVMELEHVLGVRLLDRTTRRVRTTEAGLAYYERCVDILARVEETEMQVARLHGEPIGVLRLNGPASFGALYLAPAVSEFMGRHPKIKIELTLTDRFIDPIEEGADVTIRIAELANSSSDPRKLAPARRAFVGSPSYVARQGEPMAPEDLARHACLTYGHTTTLQRWRVVQTERPPPCRSIPFCAPTAATFCARPRWRVVALRFCRRSWLARTSKPGICELSSTASRNRRSASTPSMRRTATSPPRRGRSSTSSPNVSATSRNGTAFAARAPDGAAPPCAQASRLRRCHAPFGDERKAPMTRMTLATFAIAASAGIAVAATGLDEIKERQDLMKADGAATKPIVAMLQGKAPFDLATVQKTLKTYENAASKEVGLFPPDSKTGDKTQALPAIWEDDNMADFNERFKKFGADAAAGARDDQGRGELQGDDACVLHNCGACHEKYKAKQQ